MNKQRRTRLAKLVDILDEATAELTEIRDEEEEALENMPDSLRESERGQAIEEAHGTLDNAVVELESLTDEIRELSD